MMQQGSYVTPILFGHPQYEKPPLFYWLLMASFEITGVTRAAARFVPLLSGLLGIFATFYFCRRVLNREIAWLAGILLATSAIYLALSEAVLTDITLSVLMMVALYAFYLWTLERRDVYLYAYGVAAALAVLTKGPVAIVILFLVAVLFLTMSREFNLLGHFLIHPWVLLFCAVSAPWYADILAPDRKAVFNEVIVHDNIDRILPAQHSSFHHRLFYPATALVGLFPWTFDLAVMGRRWKDYKREYLFFLTWFAVTFGVFEIAASKLASYILPLFPAIVIPLAISLSDVSPRSRSRYALSAMQVVPGLVLIALPAFLAPEIGGINTAGSAIGIRALGFALIAGAFFFWLGRIEAAVLTKALGVAALVLVLGSSLSPAVDCEVSDAFIKNIVTQERYGDQAIVTDRRYARGVHFHTGNPVVVMDHNKQPYWSPHPIEIMSGRDEIESFFAGRDRVLCVVNNSDAKELDRMFEGRRTSRPIAHDGDKIVLMSEKVLFSEGGSE